MKVLVACEESQAVTKELRNLGHEAYSCDIIECSGGHPEWHIQGDVLKVLNPELHSYHYGVEHDNEWCGIEFETVDGKKHFIEGKWDMIIAHPPCTYLTVTGNRWFNIERYGEKALKRIADREEAAAFFMKIADADCDRIAIENPVGYMNTYFRKPDQIIQPYMFGDAFEKKTCLWLKGVDLLKPTNEVEPPTRKEFSSGKTIPTWYAELWHLPKEERSRLRSKTFPGIAKAMAEQWGGYIERNEEKEMELKVKSFTIPEAIEFNYDELKREIAERTEKYTNLVYTEEQIRDAKKDASMLRKFKTALSDERIRVKKECMKAVEPFEEKVKELCAIVDTSIKNIDKQIKETEEKKKQEKYNEIHKYFEELEKPEWLNMLQIFNEKWLNASTSMKSIQEEIVSELARIKHDLETIAKMPEFAFEATEIYKDTLDMTKAVQEIHRLSELQNKKAEYETKMVNSGIATPEEAKDESTVQQFSETNNEPKKQEVCFRCWLSTEDALELREFFKERNIEYKAIK